MTPYMEEEPFSIDKIYNPILSEQLQPQENDCKEEDAILVVEYSIVILTQAQFNPIGNGEVVFFVKACLTCSVKNLLRG